MEERKYHLVVPFDPGIVLGPILTYREEFLKSIRKLGTVPNEFEEIKALLNYHIHQRKQLGVPIHDLHELCAMLSDLPQETQNEIPIVPAWDLIDNREAIDTKSQLEIDSPHLKTLNDQITHLARISQRLNDDIIIRELLNRLVQYYLNYRDALCDPKRDISELLKTTPTICGLDVPFSELGHDLALKINCINSYGYTDRKNEWGGRHATIRHGDLYFKPKDSSDFALTFANSANYFYQVMNQRYRVATPGTLIIVRDIQLVPLGKEEESIQKYVYDSNGHPYFGNVIYTSSVSEGVILNIPLQLERAFIQWKKSISIDDLACKLSRFTEAENYQVLLKNCGLEKENQRDLSLYLKKLPEIVKNYTPEKAISEMPNFSDSLDWYTTCAKVLADIVINATDMSAGNMNVCFHPNHDGGEPVRYTEGFDNDEAFKPPIVVKDGEHFFTLKSMQMFYNLNRIFDPELKKQLLKFPAIYMWLSVFQLIIKDQKDFQERNEQQVFTERYISTDGKPCLGMPGQFHETVPYRMLTLLEMIQKLLRENEELTLEALIDRLCPLLGLYIKLLKKLHSDNPLMAYEEHHRGGISIERVFEMAKEPVPDLTKYHLTEEEAGNLTLSPQNAVSNALTKYRHEGSGEGSTEELYRWLEYVGANFPFVKQVTLAPEKINELLLNISDTMLPNALDFLLRLGANPKCMTKNQETVLHRVFSRDDLESIIDADRVIRVLLSNKKIDPDSVSSSGFTPLTTFICHAKNYSIKFISFVVNLFVQRGVDLNKKILIVRRDDDPHRMTQYRTVMDYAVENRSSRLLFVLADYGGRIFGDLIKAVQFSMNVRDDETLSKAILMLSRLNPEFNFRRNFSIIARDKSDNQFDSVIEGANNIKYFLHGSVGAQVFDDNGRINYKNAIKMGRFQVVKVYYENKLLFFALAEPDYPDTEVAVSRFHQVFNSYATLYSEVFGCTDKQSNSFKLLLIAASEGMTLRKVLENKECHEEVFSKLDLHSISKLVFMTVLLGLSGTSDNILVSPYQFGDHKKYLFRSLLNQGVFSPSEQEIEAVSAGLFPQFQSLSDLPFDPKAIDELLSQAPDILSLLEEWKEQLFTHECRITSFTQSRSQLNLSSLPYQSPRKNWSLFRSGDAAKYYYRYLGMRDNLKSIKNPNYTVRDFLISVEPMFLIKQKPLKTAQAQHQAQPQPQPKPQPQENRRFSKKAFKSLKTRLFTKKVSEKSVVQNSSEQTNLQDVETNHLTECTITMMGMEFRELRQVDNLVAQAIEEIKNGRLKSFNVLNEPFFRQKVLKATHWPEIPALTKDGKNLLEQVASFPYIEFVIMDCSRFSENIVSTMLSASPFLRVLNISGCSELPDNLSTLLADHCPSVSEVVIDRTLISKFPLAPLKYLQILSAANCINLQAMELNTPNLVELNLHSSKKLNLLLVHARMPQLKKVIVDECNSLDPNFLRSLIVLAESLRDLHYLNVPTFNALGFIRAAAADKKFITGNTSLVQRNVLKLFGVSLPEEDIVRIFRQCSVSHLHKNLRPTVLDLRGCIYSLRALASMIEQNLNLEQIIFQPNLSSARDSAIQIKSRDIKAQLFNDSQIYLAGEQKRFIKKMIQLSDGFFIFLYNDASYKIWDIDDLENLRFKMKGKLGKVLTDADLLPSGDLLVCCDGKAKILDTITGEVTKKTKGGNYQYAKVIGTKRLVLGGNDLSFYEISKEGFNHKRTFRYDARVCSMVLTPNQKSFVAQIEKTGTFIWQTQDGLSFEEVEPVYLGEQSSTVAELIVIDDNIVMMTDSYTGNQMFLNVMTKKLAVKKSPLTVSFGVRAPGGKLVLGSSDSTDLVVYDHYSNKYDFPFKAILVMLFEDTNASLMGEPCFTGQGDLLVNLGQSAWIIPCKVLDLSFDFACSLPTTLSIEHKQTQARNSELKISHQPNVKKVEITAFAELCRFVKKFFEANNFTFISGEYSISIVGIPTGDACVYKRMFESFVRRAEEFQKTFDRNQKNDPRLLKLSGSRQAFFSSQTVPQISSVEETKPLRKSLIISETGTKQVDEPKVSPTSPTLNHSAPHRDKE